MGNLNIDLRGFAGRVADCMMRTGYVKTKTEAIRLALFEFNEHHGVVPDEELAYAMVAKDIADKVDSGKMKAKPFKLRELD